MARQTEAERLAALRAEFDALRMDTKERIVAMKVADALDPLPQKARRKILRAVLAGRRHEAPTAELPA